MPPKYECPRCNRRFTEWGAEKFGFKCPGDEWCPEDRPEDIELVRVGGESIAKPAKKTSLKRKKKELLKPAASAIGVDATEDEAIMPDFDSLAVVEDLDELEVSDEEEPETEEEEEEIVVLGDTTDAVPPTDDGLTTLTDEDDLVGDETGAEEEVEEEWED